jgi:hypothetical protein
VHSDIFPVPDWSHFSESSDFLGLLPIKQNTRRNKSFQGKKNLFQNPTESGLRPEFWGEGPLKGATCSKHKAGRLKNHKKAGVNDGILLLQRPAASRYAVLPCCRAAATTATA